MPGNRIVFDEESSYLHVKRVYIYLPTIEKLREASKAPLAPTKDRRFHRGTIPSQGAQPITLTKALFARTLPFRACLLIEELNRIAFGLLRSWSSTRTLHPMCLRSYTMFPRTSANFAPPLGFEQPIRSNTVGLTLFFASRFMCSTSSKAAS